MYIETRGFISVNNINTFANYLESKNISFNFNDDGCNIYFDIDTKILIDLYNNGFLSELELSEAIKNCNVLEFYEG